MNFTFKIYKGLIWTLFVLTIIGIVILTTQAVAETDDWKWFDVDYADKHEIISAYGSLIGGVLAFLSILFVLFQVYEQREHLWLEQEERKAEVRREYLSRMKLLNSFLLALIADIGRLGEELGDYCDRVRKEPSNNQFMHFYMNSNFSRVIDMDVLTNYKAFEVYFKSNEEWEMLFLNLYSRVDLYSDKIVDIRNSYKDHVREMEREQIDFAETLNKFMLEGARLIDEYIIEHGKEKCFNHPWSSLVMQVQGEIQNYIQKCISKNEVQNSRYLSDTYLKPFIKEGMQIFHTIGYDTHGSRILIELAYFARKKNSSIELHSKQHIESISQLHDRYFDPSKIAFNYLKNIQIKISRAIDDAKLK